MSGKGLCLEGVIHGGGFVRGFFFRAPDVLYNHLEINMWFHLLPLTLEGCKDTHMGTAVTRAGVNSIQIQSIPIPTQIYCNLLNFLNTFF